MPRRSTRRARSTAPRPTPTPTRVRPDRDGHPAGTSGSGRDDSAPGHQAWLFDADRSDRPIELGSSTALGLKDHQLLWLDIRDQVASEAVRALLDFLPLDARGAQRFAGSSRLPRLRLTGTDFQLRVLAIRTAGGLDVVSTLDIIAGSNFVVTIHPERIGSLDNFADRVAHDTVLGRLDSGAFVAVLLDEVITGYFGLSDDLAAVVDRLDGEALRPTGRTDLLDDMVALRHRIAAARRALTLHREVVAALARADFEAISGTSATPHFLALAERFTHAIDAIDGSRESLVGTFDIHMTRTSQRTNDIVRTLTTVSVLLLPAGVISSFMAMNEKPPYSIEDPRIFWVVLLVIIGVATFTLVMLRRRGWV